MVASTIDRMHPMEVEPPFRLRRLADALACAALLAGLAMRVWGAWAARCLTEPDPTVVALMARHMAALKEFPIFFYGQSYMGSLEPMASALMVRWLGSTGFAVNLGPVLFAAAALFFLWRWARDAAGPWSGLAVALASLCGPSVFFQFQMAPRGGYMVALWVDALALFAASRMAARLRAGEPVGLGRFVALGALAGVGLWSNMIVVPALAVAALLLAHGMRWQFVRHGAKLAAGVAGTFLGALPWLIYNMRHEWVSMQMSQISGHEPLRAALVHSWQRFLLLHDDGKTALGGHLPLLLAAGMLALAAMGGWAIWVRRKEALLRENYARFSALLYCGLFALVFVTSGFTRTPTARYWVPIVPGLAMLVAAACAAPGSRIRRGAAWGLLAGLTWVQVGLCVAAVRPAAARAESCLAAFRELGAALDSIGADGLLAPLQLYSLNFANNERVPVSNGKQKFYEPILRAVELADFPAYASDYFGIESFLRQRGAEWESIDVAGRRLFWSVRVPTAADREMSPEAIVALHDDLGTDQQGTLEDRNVDTWWSPGAADASALEWTLAEPRAIRSIYFLFAHGMADDAFVFARRIRIEAKRGGEWQTVLEGDPIVPLEVSGPRIYFPSGLARMEYRIGGGAAEAVRVSFLDTRAQAGRVGWRLAEAALCESDPDCSLPPMEPAAVDELGRWLRTNEPDSIVHAPRWVSNQLLKRGWVSRERLAGLSARVFPPVHGMPGEGRVAADRANVFLVESRHRKATVATLASQCSVFREEPIGPWIAFSVGAESWDEAVWGLPPAILWTGDALLSGHSMTRASEALRRLLGGEEPEDRQRALLCEVARWRPSALSALAASDVLRLGGEEAAELRSREARGPRDLRPTEFANGLRLEGVDVESAGMAVEVRLFWSAGASFAPEQEMVFIHLRDAEGRIVAQDDYRGSPPLWGAESVRPVSGEIVDETRRIRLPVGLPPGPLELCVGLYDPQKGRRIRILQSAAPTVRRRAAVWPAAVHSGG